MTFRPPQSLSAGHRAETGVDVLHFEIAQQKAETLGALGGQVEAALARLKALDATGTPEPVRRSALLDEAADRVWSLMIQRELCGLRHWEAVVKAYGIPREVLNRMGRSKTPDPAAR
ncbi:hypothetical protein GCM10007036_11050 [Alsobacter metallidurans]|uniref:Uncharacterized protein n=1 Tax=Alsobacter metallidurans TaxID=340221 RepID=A0A917I476_9HYPH|nr:DUF6665 family protein [Alsobacter metallidurans]GGH12858.1 hypothetical protein GCM10007036_11050 [Alsobacter metallidurans]